MTTTLDLPFQLGEPRSHGAITITPLFPTRDPVCDYVSLDEALPKGLEIGEVNAAGVVGELAVKNPLGLGVLLYDGEELVGAKQNRILNLTVLLAAGSTTRIPVSCVEQGRWSARSRLFASAGHVAGPELRRRKAESLRGDALARGVAQHEVWSVVGEQLADRQVASPTAAYSDGIAKRSREITDRSQRFTLEPGQCGMLVDVAGQGWCIDAVSRPAVFARMFTKLVAGYAYEAGDESGVARSPESVIASLATGRVRTGPSVADGQDLRIEGDGVIGSGLMVDGELVQLSAYGR